MKKMVLSAVALIGMTVASYGANTVEVTSDPCSDCYHNFNNAFNALTALGADTDDTLDFLEPIFDKCVAKHCDN